MKIPLRLYKRLKDQIEQEYEVWRYSEDICITSKSQLCEMKMEKSLLWCMLMINTTDLERHKRTVYDDMLTLYIRSYVKKKQVDESSMLGVSDYTNIIRIKLLVPFEKVANNSVGFKI